MSKQFNITINKVNFVSDEDGLLNLNEIARAFKLKSPSQWRNKESAYLIDNAKLHSLSYKASGGAVVKYWAADEDATIFYANYISMEFALSVVQAFRELRNGNTAKALDLAQTTTTDSLQEKVWDRLMTQATTTVQFGLTAMGIEHPNLFMRYVREGQQLDNLIEKGYFIWRNYGAKYGSSLKLTPKGMQWLLTKHEGFNKLVKDKKKQEQKFKREMKKLGE